MTTMEIGKELVALCKQGKNQEAIDRFYSTEYRERRALFHAGHGTDSDGNREDQGKESMVGRQSSDPRRHC